ncbi:MAG: hypothetical protein EXS14_03285 [Planctomycetes bacterium]|nr:hypothetical protein [Planctomycetota bacterium]
MRTPVARYGIGSLLLLVLYAIFVLDRNGAVITPALALLLGLGAGLEYWKVAGGGMPSSVRAAGIPLMTLFVAGAAVLAYSGNRAGLDLHLGLMLPLALFIAALALLASRRVSPVEVDDFATTLHLPACVAMTILPSAALAALALVPGCGMAFVFTVIIGSKLNDIGGYIGGTLLGRSKLCPGISPNKTIEGAVVGVLFGVGGTWILASALPELAVPLSSWRAPVLGLALALATQVGDLFESAFKRSLKVKDSAALLPAFGGLLDLLDSFIFAAPLGYTLARAWTL